jgi:hypothetical protein
MDRLSWTICSSEFMHPNNAVQMNNAITAAAILRALSVPPPTPKAQMAAFDRYAGVKVLPREEFRPFFPALKSLYLREYVNEWFATGIAADGSEKPAARSLHGAPRAHAAVAEYLAAHRPYLMPSDQGDFSVTLAEHPDYSALDGDIFVTVRTDAIRHFVGLMLSGWKNQLCRCRHCGCYFLHKKPRRSYRHGTFCNRAHQSRHSAAIRTNERRVRMRTALIELAAAWLAERGYSAWQTDTKLKRRLAAFLSHQMNRNPNLCAGRHDVRAHWVTRHATEIEGGRRLLTKKTRNVLAR